MKQYRILVGVGVVALAAQTSRLPADEGLWLFSDPPREALQQRYAFQPSQAGLDRLRLASVNFGGASAAFVSEDGLILSNHHVGAGAIERLSTAEKNYVRDGFLARTLEEELRCEGLELKVLVAMENVTDQVKAAVTPGMSDAEAFAARRAAMAAIEQASFESTGLRSDVVTLYQGAQFHLYRYKTYRDIRLVFAPEEQSAFFGGDPDNFEYPRFVLDVAFFRAYEDGRPARTPNYLAWSREAVREGDLVFVSGHPGRTDRLRTVAELEYLRDVEFPRVLERLKRTEVLLLAYSARSGENARRANDDLGSVANSRKVRDGSQEGLMDPALMNRKRAAEQALRAEVEKHPDLHGVRGAWDRIAEAQREIARCATEHDLLERATGFNTPLFGYARQLLRAPAERAKPNGERLEEYRDSALPSLRQRLFAPRPIYEDLETLKLGDSLTYLAETLGYDHAVVQTVLDGTSPRKRAAHLISQTRLASAPLRKAWFESPSQETFNDPMVRLAAAVDEAARVVRKRVETANEAIRQAHAQIGQARYALYGSSIYPDATGTLRLSFGEVKGYAEAGRPVPFTTRMAGLYERAAERGERPPFDLTRSWVEGRDRLDLTTPFNFVCTADSIGGNSGSPIVNRKGELVGVIFDSNIHALTGNFMPREEQGRAIAVDAQGVLEALRKVYAADRLLQEIETARKAAP